MYTCKFDQSWCNILRQEKLHIHSNAIVKNTWKYEGLTVQDLTLATAQTRLPNAPDTVHSTYTNHSLNIERDTIERICIDEFEQEYVHCLW